MKDGFVLFLVCLTLVGMVGMWRANIDPLHPFPSKLPYVQRLPDDPTRKPVITPPYESPVHHAVHVKEMSATVSRVEPKPAPAPRRLTPDPPPQPKFPSVEQITVGAEKPRIMEQFGDPSLTTTTSKGGHVMETYVYTKSGGEALTFIRFEDGKVAAAYTIPQVRRLH